MKFVDNTHLLVTFRGTWALAEVFLGSADGMSLVIRFDGILGPYNRMMPLVWVGDGYRDLREGIYVGILSLVELRPSSSIDRVSVGKHRQISASEVLAIPDGEAPWRERRIKF